jgi:hypothetical protein
LSRRYLLAASLLAAPALASQWTIHVGPPSVGNGGSNPVSLPPVNPIEYEVELCTDSGTEWNFAVTPGILAGARTTFAKNFYSSFGGGYVINANGSGPGIYSSLGANIAWFNMEFKQALGFDFDSNSLLSPYAIRVGVTFKL